MGLFVGVPVSSMPRDVRIAKALLEHLASGDSPNQPMTIAFTMYEEDCDVMTELYQAAEWTSWKKWEHMRSTFSSVASKLSDWCYLSKKVCVHNQEALENGEPKRWFVYELHYKYRARLNPSKYPHYKPDRSPEEEMAYILWRVFDYEVHR